jgi:hypothetical protein
MIDWLPFSTAHDPTEDPPGSVDPLGTLAEAERLANILLPGFTVRMWRPRLLTFTTVASVIADRAVRLTGQEEVRLDARLVFERMFVAAAIAQADVDPDGYRNAGVRLPGRRLAEQAWREGEPLRASNFLKGQAVNGPFGVMARLARSLGLVDPDGRPGRSSSDLLLAWSADQSLTDFLEDPGQADGDGSRWAERITKTVVQGLGKNGVWPSRNQQVWEMLASKLRPNGLQAGKERKALVKALEIDPVRRRMFELLRTPESLDAYRKGGNRDRGAFERTILLDTVRPLLFTEDPVDRTIASCLMAIDGYEKASAILQQVFDALLWGLRERSGQAKEDEILNLTPVSRAIERAVSNARTVSHNLEKVATDFKDLPIINALARAQAIERIRDDVKLCGISVKDAVSAVMGRHQQIQQEKRKATWIDCGPTWLLVPGRGTDADRPPEYRNTFLHPMRIVNGFSFLSELSLARLSSVVEADDN